MSIHVTSNFDNAKISFSYVSSTDEKSDKKTKKIDWEVLVLGDCSLFLDIYLL